MTKFTTTASGWPTIDEESAMVEAARKNPQAFAALYDRYVQPIYRYLYSRVGSGADAEDLTAQTFPVAFAWRPRQSKVDPSA